MAGHAFVVYESPTQIIIIVTLAEPDGREFSVDIRKHPGRIQVERTDVVLVAGDYIGTAMK